MSVPDHYPQEYLDGEVEFFYLRFFVTPDVLIPRLETETLVRTAISFIKSESIDTVLDIGTGSGIIPISLKKHLPSLQVYGGDISPKALHIAEKNNAYHTTDVTFFQSDLLQAFIKTPIATLMHRRILLTANLPYIKLDDWEHMSLDTKYEPKLALF